MPGDESNRDDDRPTREDASPSDRSMGGELVSSLGSLTAGEMERLAELYRSGDLTRKQEQRVEEFAQETRPDDRPFGPVGATFLEHKPGPVRNFDSRFQRLAGSWLPTFQLAIVEVASVTIAFSFTLLALIKGQYAFVESFPVVGVVTGFGIGIVLLII